MRFPVVVILVGFYFWVASFPMKKPPQFQVLRNQRLEAENARGLYLLVIVAGPAPVNDSGAGPDFQETLAGFEPAVAVAWLSASDAMVVWLLSPLAALVRSGNHPAHSATGSLFSYSTIRRLTTSTSFGTTISPLMRSPIYPNGQYVMVCPLF